MMQAVTPMRVNLNRFEDSMLYALNNRANNNGTGTGAGMGEVFMPSTLVAGPDPTTDSFYAMEDGTIVYTDAKGAAYVLDDIGEPIYLQASPAPGSSTGTGTGSSGGSGFDFGGLFSSILGTGKPTGTTYTLPNGTPVTVKANPAVSTQWVQGVPNAYLVIGGLTLVVILMGRR